MHSLPVAVLCLLIGSAAPAGAETMDTITFAFASESFQRYPGLPPMQIEGVDFSSVLPSVPQPVGATFAAESEPGFWYNTDGLPFSEQPRGAPGTSFHFAPGTVSFVPTGDINSPRAYDSFTLAGDRSLYAGPASAPMLVSGVYNAEYVLDVFGVGDFHLPGVITIAPESAGTSTVPEPGSFGLVAGGVLAMLGTWRGRRRVA